jgi:hypothetical protein
MPPVLVSGALGEQRAQRETENGCKVPEQLDNPWQGTSGGGMHEKYSRVRSQLSRGPTHSHLADRGTRTSYVYLESPHMLIDAGNPLGATPSRQHEFQPAGCKDMLDKRGAGGHQHQQYQRRCQQLQRLHLVGGSTVQDAAVLTLGQSGKANNNVQSNIQTDRRTQTAHSTTG